MREHETQEDASRAADEERWIDVMRNEIVPPERSSSQRAAFTRRLEAQLSARDAVPWRPLAFAACATALAGALWLGLPASERDGASGAPEIATASPNGLLAYAYYETTYLDDEEENSPFLSDEYEAIAAAFDVP